MQFNSTHDFAYSKATLFGWHESPAAFLRLNPPWNPATVLHSDGHIRDGARVRIRIDALPLFSSTWELEHCGYNPPHAFEDVQVHGPFSRWRHLHRFEELSPTHTRLSDEISFALPLGGLGAIGNAHVERQLARLFSYRYRVLENDLRTLTLWPSSPLRIAMSGSSGLVGSALRAFLTTAGHTVFPIVRTNPQPGEIFWSLRDQVIDAKALEGLDAVIHLAGENIASGRWSEEKKRAIEESRVKSSELLVAAIARLRNPPKVLITASAVGYYGDRGDSVLTEDSAKGHGFLPEVAERWEDACFQAHKFGCRVIASRFGVVLDPRGGALAKMLPAFRIGAGGVLGSGTQWMSWITIDDLLYSFAHMLHSSTLKGPINVCSPHPITNREFTRTLAHLLSRPAVVTVPKLALKVLYGQMANEALLASVRVAPQKLADSGFQWCYPQLEDGLVHVMGLQKPV